MAAEVPADARELERRLVGLGLDVHDGPLQELSALRLDLYLFRTQMASVIESDDIGAILLGRVSDLSARLEATEEELRRLSSLAGSSALLTGPFSSTVRRIVSEHARGRPVSLELDSEVDRVVLEDEMRIALLRVVQTAVANIAQHSGAKSGRVVARRLADRIEIEIHDDGQGFKVAASEQAASEQSHLGLFGMRERIGQLGGSFRIESSPGAGTRVYVEAPLSERLERST